MFGRQPNMPMDIILDNYTRQFKNSAKSKYIESLKYKLKFYYNRALKNIKDAKGRQKRNHDVTIKSGVKT